MLEAHAHVRKKGAERGGGGGEGSCRQHILPACGPALAAGSAFKQTKRLHPPPPPGLVRQLSKVPAGPGGVGSPSRPSCWAKGRAGASASLGRPPAVLGVPVPVWAHLWLNDLLQPATRGQAHFFAEWMKRFCCHFNSNFINDG